MEGVQDRSDIKVLDGVNNISNSRYEGREETMHQANDVAKEISNQFAVDDEQSV